MLGKKEKGAIELKCTEQYLPEFPNLLIGTTNDGTKFYCDATIYLHKQDPNQRSIREFFSSYNPQILALCEAYEIPYSEVCKINEQGHYLIDGNFIYLFISFVEPTFLAFMCDRVHEIMERGVSVSDSYILSEASKRLTPEVINSVFENDKTGEQ